MTGPLRRSWSRPHAETQSRPGEVHPCPRKTRRRTPTTPALPMPDTTSSQRPNDIEPGVLQLTEQAAGLLLQPVLSSSQRIPTSIWNLFGKPSPCFVSIPSQGATGLTDYLDLDKRELFKPEAIWEIEQGSRLTALDVCQACLVRGTWWPFLHCSIASTSCRAYKFFRLRPTLRGLRKSTAAPWTRIIAGWRSSSVRPWQDVRP